MQLAARSLSTELIEEMHLNQSPLLYLLPTPPGDVELMEMVVRLDPFRLELLPDNQLLIMPPVSTEFDTLNVWLVTELSLWNRRDQLGVVYGPSGGWRLPDGSVRAPDAAWVSSDRLKATVGSVASAYTALCPDFIVELRSPSDRLEGQSPAALFRKMEAWMSNGARLAWLIDPIDECAYVYRPNAAPVRIASFDAVLSGEDVLVGFELPLHRLRLPK